MREDRARHRDLVVGGELPDRPRRRVIDRRETAAEFGQRLGLDVDDQPLEHVVVQRDLLGIVMLGIEKQIGDAPNDDVPPAAPAPG